MLNFFEENFPDDVTLLKPNNWPLNYSPDQNPLDFGIWSILEQRVYTMKVRDRQDFTDRLGEAWEKLSQESIDSTIKAIR